MRSVHESIPTISLCPSQCTSRISIREWRISVFINDVCRCVYFLYLMLLLCIFGFECCPTYLMTLFKMSIVVFQSIHHWYIDVLHIFFKSMSSFKIVYKSLEFIRKYFDAQMNKNLLLYSESISMIMNQSEAIW